MTDIVGKIKKDLASTPAQKDSAPAATPAAAPKTPVPAPSNPFLGWLRDRERPKTGKVAEKSHERCPHRDDDLLVEEGTPQ